jgi:P-type E1-E2 ATPase
MIEVEVAGAAYHVEHVVLDFNGTIAYEGQVDPGVLERMNELSTSVTLHVVTADTFGSARAQLAGTACQVQVLRSEDHTAEKAAHVAALSGRSVAIGNGANDAGMLDAADVAMAVIGPEGCAGLLLARADIVLPNITAAFAILLQPTMLRATLRV